MRLIKYILLFVLLSTVAFGQNAQKVCAEFEAHATQSNRILALGNRLIEHYKDAQRWESIDPKHPSAVEVRDKISHEEPEFIEAIQKLHSLADSDKELREKITIAMKKCPESVRRDPMHEVTAMLREWKSQRERYQALGYGD